MNVLDLFSGIGGFSLGLERAGMRTVAFCEIDPYCRAVLRKHWPGVPCYDDVRTLTADRLKADGIAADVVCGGFPCQDISQAGRREGIGGERSGLWKDYARLVGELRPLVVIVENVSALLGRGLDVVLGDLATLGYDAEWHCIPASAIGAPHRRDRVWIVANPGCQHRERRGGERGGPEASGSRDWPARSGEHSIDVAHRVGAGLEGHGASGWRPGSHGPISEGYLRSRGRSVGQWLTEPDVGRVAHGIPSRVDRLKGLGNAVVPQITEIIGRAIMTAVSTNNVPTSKGGSE